MLFDPYMCKVLSHVMSPELSIYTTDTASDLALE